MVFLLWVGMLIIYVLFLKDICFGSFCGLERWWFFKVKIDLVGFLKFIIILKFFFFLCLVLVNIRLLEKVKNCWGEMYFKVELISV